ncbi:hypothetical protein E8E13_005431 [Curvularia kusanoi]|uniref:J domain-containing protein n=1 Tax=Curvularia kusanoi TaxID=90978 RepID=A0A9P4T977_CURKU|nr:hypothetical protein E8E13_005431 [Curvularia kusanoi]
MLQTSVEQVQEAYETLGDISKRRRYDGQYGSIQSQWMTYRRALEQWRQAELQRTHQKMNGARERERQLNAAKAARERKREEQESWRKGEEKEKPGRAEKERLAKERSRQAANRARAEFQKGAIARLRLMKETEAEARSAAVLEKARQQQTQKAQERLAAQATEHEAIIETEVFKDVLSFLYWMLEWLPSS